MKKLLTIILTLTMLLSIEPFSLTISAQDGENPHEINTGEVFNETYQSEKGNDYQKTNDPPNGSSLFRKFVAFIVTGIISGYVYDGYKYILQSLPDVEAVIQWMNEGGFAPDEYTYKITRVVYDNGCWKPEFPANPFC